MSTKNLHPIAPQPGTYAAEFLERLDRIDDGLELLQMPMSELCRRADVARSTPDRWRRIIPKTVEMLTRMEAEVGAELRKARESGRIPPTVQA